MRSRICEGKQKRHEIVRRDLALLTPRAGESLRPRAGLLVTRDHDLLYARGEVPLRCPQVHPRELLCPHQDAQ